MRKSLEKFANYCEKILKENDYKGGWKVVQEDYLLEKLIQQTYDLHYAIQNNRYPIRADENIKQIKKQCADVANFAMMIFDTI